MNSFRKSAATSFGSTLCFLRAGGPRYCSSWEALSLLVEQGLVTVLAVAIIQLACVGTEHRATMYIPRYTTFVYVTAR